MIPAFCTLQVNDLFWFNTTQLPNEDWVKTSLTSVCVNQYRLFRHVTPALQGVTCVLLDEKLWQECTANGQIRLISDPPTDPMIDPDEALASTRANLEAAKTTIERQAARIAELEAENATLRERTTLLETRKEADADAETIRRLARYQRRAEMCVWGPEDADEEGGQ